MSGPKGLPERREQTGDAGLDRVDQAREDLANALRFNPFLRGRLVSVRFVSGVRKVVRHGLGVAAACMVVRLNYDNVGSGPLFAESTDRTTGVDPTQQLALLAHVDCDVDLWFYARASKDIDARQGQSL